MKLIRFLSLMLACIALLSFVSCDTAEEPRDNTDTTAAATDAPTEAPTEAETQPPVDPATDGRVRVIIASDLHYTTIETYYGMTTDDRMQHFVDTVLWEHKQKPIDLLIIAGDTSLDHLFKRGTWTANKVSTTLSLREKYLSQIKAAGIPIFTVAGNHEQFNNDQWKQFAGNDRRGSVAIEGNLFIMLDAFSVDLEPNYDYDPTYANHDVAFIKEQMALHPECENVYLIAHYFNYKTESAEFKQLIRDDKRIKGLFQGHTHENTVIDMGYDLNHKLICQTGQFSQFGTIDQAKKNNFWGFRELIITPDVAISNYIIAKTKIVFGGTTYVDQMRTTINSARFY